MNNFSSRDAKSSTTPASLRKELRHLSREISSSSDVLPQAFSNKKGKAASKVAEKENFRPFNHSAAGQAWISGGGAASPAVFSFYGAHSPPKSQSLQVAPLVAATGSFMPAASVEKSRANQSYTSTSNASIYSSTSNVWMPGSVIPRGLMVRQNSQKSHFLKLTCIVLQRISSHVTSDALSHLAGILCFWRVLASQLTRSWRAMSSARNVL